MTEKQLQIQIVNYLKIMERQGKIITFFAVKNDFLGGAKNNAIYINSLKAQGLRVGVSDLIILTSSKTLFVELKVGKNKQTQSQLDFEKQISKCENATYFVVKKLTEMEGIVNNEKICKNK
jgi:hypothetical protein